MYTSKVKLLYLDLGRARSHICNELEVSLSIHLDDVMVLKVRGFLRGYQTMNTRVI